MSATKASGSAKTARSKQSPKDAKGAETEVSTRDRILEAALEMTLAKGFNAVSLQELADQIGIRKASLFHHFASKDELGLALLEIYRGRFLRWSDRAWSQNPTGRDRAEVFFKMLKEISGRCERICLGGAFAAEWNTLSDGLKAALNGFHSAQKDWVLKVLKEARRQGELRRTADLEGQADAWLAAVQGSLQLARLRGDPGAIDAVARQLLDAFFLERKGKQGKGTP